MSSTLRTSLLFTGLLVVVILVSYGYSRTLNKDKTQSGQPPAAEAPRTSAPLPQTLHRDLEAGLEAYGNGELERAIDSLGKVPADDPGYMLALQNLGAARLKLGQADAARESFGELAGLQHDNPESQLMFGWASYKAKRPDDAELAALRALELAPEHTSARYHLALYRVLQGRLPTALGTYLRAFDGDPRREYAPRAFEELLQLHAAHPELADVHYAVAFFANSLGRRELEATELEHYLALDPVGPAVQNARNQLAEAREALR